VKTIFTALINLKALWRDILIPIHRWCKYITGNWKNLLKTTQQVSSKIGIRGCLLEIILLIQTYYFSKYCHF